MQSLAMMRKTLHPFQAPRVDYTTALVNDVKNLKNWCAKEFFGEGLNSEVRKAMEEAIETYKN